MHRAPLRRLQVVFSDDAVFFITVCTHCREPLLASASIQAILTNVWRSAVGVHHWQVGRYVIMPDHVHFFCAKSTSQAVELSRFVGKWKELCAKAARAVGVPLRWQRGFFDHVLRSSESYEEKWEYVRANPERAGLVAASADWPWQGELSELTWH